MGNFNSCLFLTNIFLSLWLFFKFTLGRCVLILRPHLNNFTMYIILNLFICFFQVIRISTFEPSCVGILTREQYRISLLVKRVDYISVIMTFIGLALFYYAKDLCRNVFFHYTTGVGVGIFLSLVVIIYFIQKRVSKQ